MTRLRKVRPRPVLRAGASSPCSRLAPGVCTGAAHSRVQHAAKGPDSQRAIFAVPPRERRRRRSSHSRGPGLCARACADAHATPWLSVCCACHQDIKKAVGLTAPWFDELLQRYTVGTVDEVHFESFVEFLETGRAPPAALSTNCPRRATESARACARARCRQL